MYDKKFTTLEMQEVEAALTDRKIKLQAKVKKYPWSHYAKAQLKDTISALKKCSFIARDYSA